MQWNRVNMTRDLVVGPRRPSQGSGLVLEALEMRANSASVFWVTEIATLNVHSGFAEDSLAPPISSGDD